MQGAITYELDCMGTVHKDFYHMCFLQKILRNLVAIRNGLNERNTSSQGE